MSQSESPLHRYLRDPSLLLQDALHLLRELLGTLTHLAPVGAGVLFALLLGGLAFARLRERLLARGARLVTVGVPPEVELNGALLLWRSLHDLIRPRLARLLSGQPHIAWEIAASGGGSEFRLWIPRSVPPGLVERALSSAWPGATTAGLESQPAPARSEEGAMAAVELVLSGPEWFPLGGSEGPDPLRLVLGQLAGLDVDEWALVQVVARPSTVRERRRLTQAARRIRAGISTHRLLRLLDLVAPGPPRRSGLDPTVNPDVRLVLEKAAHPHYRCLLRIAVGARSGKLARGRIHALAGAFAAYEGRVGLRRRRVVAARRRLRLRALGRRGYLLSIPELAALAHLPGERALPGLVRAGARSLPPPPELPRKGKPLGIADAGPPRRLAITVADARQHIHIVGATGVGKTTEMAQLVLADADAGRGAVVVDPKGDLVDDVLARLGKPPVPLVVIDPERSLRPVGLNVLQGSERELVAEHVVGTFRRIYEQFWGPRTDDILRACVLTLAGDGRMTLAEIPTCLADPAWRARLTDDLRRKDPVLAGFWRWYDGLSEQSRVQAVGPLLNKLRAFLLRRPVRAMVGQEKTSFDLKAVLDGGLLLARLPKGSLGEETSRLLGALLVARVWQQVLGRSRVPEAARRDCALYVDEVHNYLALPRSFDDLLAEARGYRLSLCLAHQHLGQLPKQMAEALSANARTKLVFTCSPEDARALERHMAPDLTAHDLANLGRYQAACRTLADGRETRPFTLRTEPLPDGDRERARELREASELGFGKEIDDVERRLRLRQFAPTVRPSTPLSNPPADPPSTHDRPGDASGISVHRRAFTPSGGIPDKGGNRR